MATLENHNHGHVHVGQVCYLRCVVTHRELAGDEPLAWVEAVDKQGFVHQDHPCRVYAVPEALLVPAKIVAEEMR